MRRRTRPPAADIAPLWPRVVATAVAVAVATAGLTALLLLTAVAQGGNVSADGVASGAAARQKGHLGGPLRSLALANGLVYAAFGTEVAQVDLDAVGGPRRRDYIVLTELVWDLAVQTEIAYVATGSAGLQIIDFSGATPALVAAIPTAGSARAVAVTGQTLYLAERIYSKPFGQLHIFDIANPAAPILLASRPTIGGGQALAVAGATLYVGLDFGDVAVLDVANAANPVQIATVSTMGAATSLAVAGDTLYVGQALCLYLCDGLLSLHNVANPALPQPRGTLPLSGRPAALAVTGNAAAVLDSSGALHRVDVTDPSAPFIVGSFPLVGGGSDLVQNATTLYVGSATDGLQRFELGGPLTPTWQSGYAPPANVRGLAFRDEWLYVAADEALSIVATTPGGAPPGALTLTARVPLPGQAWDVALSYGVAVVAAGESGLQFLDVLSPTAPSLIAAYPAIADARRVVVDGDLAYVADQSGVLHIVDISIPTAPQGLSVYSAGHPIFDVAVVGSLAFVAAGHSGLHIVDVTSALAPIGLAVLDTPGDARGVSATGDRVYVADGSRGVRVVDVTNPSQPVEIGAFDLDRYTWQVAARGAFVYALEGFAGVRGLDMQAPTPAIMLDYVNTTGIAQQLALAPEHMIVADGVGGVHLYTYPFQATGEAQHANGVAYSGATVASSAGLSTTSTTAGFALTLAPGTHTLTVTADGYRTTPGVQTAVVPLAMTGLDFTVLPPPMAWPLTPTATAVLTFEDTQGLPTSLHLPTGTVTAAATLYLTPTVALPAPALTFAGHAFDLSLVVSGTAAGGFQAPVSVTIAYSAADIAAVPLTPVLDLYHLTPEGWTPAHSGCGAPVGVPTQVDSATQEVTSVLCSDGRFALFALRQEMFLPLIWRYD